MPRFIQTFRQSKLYAIAQAICTAITTVRMHVAKDAVQHLATRSTSEDRAELETDEDKGERIEGQYGRLPDRLGRSTKARGYAFW